MFKIFGFLSFGFVSYFGFRASNLLLICLAAYLLICLFPPSAGAFTMSNQNWIIKLGNFNMSSGKSADSSFKVGFSAGQTPGPYSGANYKIQIGFPYTVKSSEGLPFVFSISQTLIDFGEITANNPVSRTNILTIDPGSAGGYFIKAFEDRELSDVSSKTFIPDTTCDNGLCSPGTSDIWDNNLTFGFGYRCDNILENDCSGDFAPTKYFKSFANIKKSEDAKVIMSKSTAAKKSQGQITYKVNIPQTQEAGLYMNTITYIATPTF